MDHSKPSGYNAGARNVETPNPLGAHVADRHRWHDAWLLGSHIARESYSYLHRIQMFVTTLDLQRPADYVVGRHVEQKLAEIGEAEGSGKQLSAAE
jgi:hypothetical protein